MAKFTPGNEEWKKKKKEVPAFPKELSGSVLKRRILSWMEYTTGKNRKAIDTFFSRNDLKFEPPHISAYIAACKLSK